MAPAHAHLLQVAGLGGVDGPIAHLKGLPHGGLAGGGVHLVYAIAQAGHFDAVGEGNGFPIHVEFLLT